MSNKIKSNCKNRKKQWWLKRIKNIEPSIRRRVPLSSPAYIFLKILKRIKLYLWAREDGFWKLTRHLIFIKVALWEILKNLPTLHLNVSFRSKSYTAEAFEIDTSLCFCLFHSLPLLPRARVSFLFLFFRCNVVVRDSVWLLLLLCKKDAFQPSLSLLLSSIFVPSIPDFSTLLSWLAKAVLLNYVWSTVKVWLFLVAVTRKDGGRDFGPAETPIGRIGSSLRSRI